MITYPNVESLLHCDIYARVEIELTLTIAYVNVLIT